MVSLLIFGGRDICGSSHLSELLFQASYRLRQKSLTEVNLGHTFKAFFATLMAGNYLLNRKKAEILMQADDSGHRGPRPKLMPYSCHE